MNNKRLALGFHETRIKFASIYVWSPAIVLSLELIFPVYLPHVPRRYRNFQHMLRIVSHSREKFKFKSTRRQQICLHEAWKIIQLLRWKIAVINKFVAVLTENENLFSIEISNSFRIVARLIVFSRVALCDRLLKSSLPAQFFGAFPWLNWWSRDWKFFACRAGNFVVPIEFGWWMFTCKDAPKRAIIRHCVTLGFHSSDRSMITWLPITLLHEASQAMARPINKRNLI